MSQYAKEYRLFFESPAGKEFLTTISNLIDSNHQKAESAPDLARDFMQRAKGNREVTDHINSVTAERKEPIIL